MSLFDEMPTFATWRRRSVMLFRAVLLRVIGQYLLNCPFTLRELELVLYTRRRGADQDLSCSELLASELFGQRYMSCSCTLRKLELLHKESICLIYVIYCVILYPLKYIAKCTVCAVRKQPVITCPYSYNYFSMNPI